MKNWENNPQFFLAPMEGVVDWVMRDILSRIGGFDYCVTEFLRISDLVPPPAVYFRTCPELLQNSQTRVQTPVILQLLGGDPELLGLAAAKGIELGARGIDLNFGCPAKTVNRHDGGATLLQWPHRLHDIAKSVRGSVPKSLSVSGKMRLGFLDSTLALDNALALEAAGVSWITVHARTKLDGYKPPAHWQQLTELRERLKVPLIANGDIFNLQDFTACKAQTGCEQFMLGRGILKNPFLFREIKLGSPLPHEEKWQELQTWLIEFYIASTLFKSEYFAVARMKGWLKHLMFEFPQTQELFAKLKTFHEPEPFRKELWQTLKPSVEFHELLKERESSIPGVFQSKGWWREYRKLHEFDLLNTTTE